MKQKINVAELLKDCPCGMELDCMMYENVTFDEVITARCFDDKKRVKIILSTHYSDGTKDEIVLTEFGTYTDDETAKCIIFPKGKTTWEGFHKPFKDGDIVVNQNNNGKWIGIYHKHNFSNETFSSYCYIRRDGIFHAFSDTNHGLYKTRLATEEEKQKLFDVIKQNGYKWNPETKTLEELPKFKVGDKVKCIFNNFQYIITKLTDTHYTLEEIETKFQYTEPIIEDKNWELVPNKFDITTLKPFQKVLVKPRATSIWRASLFSNIFNDSRYPFDTVSGSFTYCIPYDGNQHLLGTTNDCDDYYKTWE